MWTPQPLDLREQERVLELERLAYGPEAEVAQPSFYEWLYRRNPSGEGRVWLASLSDGTAAGQFVLVPLRFRVAGTPGLADLALNVITHPAHRRQGVFAALCRAAGEESDARGREFTWALPNPSSCPGFLQRAGYLELGRVPLLLRPLDPGGIPRGAGWRGTALGAGARVVGLATRLVARPAPPGIAVEEVAADWGGWDALWRRLHDAYPVMVVRDAAHVLWRFGGCPTRRYRLYVARVKGDAAGFVATRQATVAGMPAGLIVDLLTTRGEDRAVGDALVARALEEFVQAGTPLAAALMLRHTREYACLKAAGFLRCPRFLEPQPFRVVFRGSGASAAASLRAWFLSMADYDVV